MVPNPFPLLRILHILLPTSIPVVAHASFPYLIVAFFLHTPIYFVCWPRFPRLFHLQILIYFPYPVFFFSPSFFYIHTYIQRHISDGTDCRRTIFAIIILTTPSTNITFYFPSQVANRNPHPDSLTHTLALGSIFSPLFFLFFFVGACSSLPSSPILKFRILLLLIQHKESSSLLL